MKKEIMNIIMLVAYIVLTCAAAGNEPILMFVFAALTINKVREIWALA